MEILRAASTNIQNAKSRTGRGGRERAPALASGATVEDLRRGGPPRRIFDLRASAEISPQSRVHKKMTKRTRLKVRMYSPWRVGVYRTAASAQSRAQKDDKTNPSSVSQLPAPQALMKHIPNKSEAKQAHSCQAQTPRSRISKMRNRSQLQFNESTGAQNLCDPPTKANHLWPRPELPHRKASDHRHEPEHLKKRKNEPVCQPCFNAIRRAATAGVSSRNDAK
jgi:hypothetical protein